jgi:hypothetical protein
MWRQKSATRSGWSIAKAALLTVLALSATTVQCADTVISCTTAAINNGAHTLSGSLNCPEGSTITVNGNTNTIAVAGSADVTITGLRFLVSNGQLIFTKLGGGTLKFVNYGTTTSTVS